MANGTIVGRENEKRLLTQIYNSNKAELTALYGRRRVGKTFLLKTFFDGKIDFNFSGLYQTDKNIQLEFFVSELRRVNKNISPDLKVKSWLEAFELLREYLSGLKKDKIVVFLDELPWMDTPKSNFMQAFSYFWNTWGCTFPALKLFVCGSATTWMMSKLIGDKGGLYGRCTKIIYLSPFTLGETEQFLSQVKNIKWTRFQILECYMILGGIPYYLDLLSKGVKFSECIDNLIFNSNGPLRIEFDFLYRSLFKDASFYRKIIEILSSKLKGLTRDEIKAAMKIKSGGSLTDALNDLCSCDFIREYTSFGKTGKQSLFQ
ncbi:MAG: AAA family ATPase, partial [Bacteroidales bacterium]|nr:AAA family ATPase [Bacteroidales bacterium]